MKYLSSVQNDPTLVAFADIFHHRALSLFYRAWADAQPTVQMDRPRNNRFAVHLGSLTGQGLASMRGRDSVEDHAKLFASGSNYTDFLVSDILVELMV